jgi:hypothetical protein
MISLTLFIWCTYFENYDFTNFQPNQTMKSILKNIFQNHLVCQEKSSKKIQSHIRFLHQKPNPSIENQKFENSTYLKTNFSCLGIEKMPKKYTSWLHRCPALTHRLRCSCPPQTVASPPAGSLPLLLSCSLSFFLSRSLPYLSICWGKQKKKKKEQGRREKKWGRGKEEEVRFY